MPYRVINEDAECTGYTASGDWTKRGLCVELQSSFYVCVPICFSRYQVEDFDLLSIVDRLTLCGYEFQGMYNAPNPWSLGAPCGDVGACSEGSTCNPDTNWYTLVKTHDPIYS